MKEGSYCQPDLEVMQRYAAIHAKEFFDSGKKAEDIVFCMLTDEPADLVVVNPLLGYIGGDIVAQTAKVLPIPKHGGWMDPGPLGTLGVGMPFALAAQLSHPDRRVLIIYGDGFVVYCIMMLGVITTTCAHAYIAPSTMG